MKLKIGHEHAVAILRGLERKGQTDDVAAALRQRAADRLVLLLTVSHTCSTCWSRSRDQRNLEHRSLTVSSVNPWSRGTFTARSVVTNVLHVVARTCSVGCRTVPI